MKKLTLAICATTFFLLSCNNNEKKTEEGKMETVTSDTLKNETGKMEMPDSATMMKNWQDYMTPGGMQKMMATWDGNWNGEVTMWMEPGAPPQVSKSTATNKMIMNGLYQQSNHSGDMMGMPFTGQSTVGYDNHKKEFVSTWIDNMGSGIMVLRGPWDDASKTMTLNGTMTDPGTKQDAHIKETFKIIDENTQEMEMFIKMPDGSEFKTMNIKYTRKK